MQTQIRRYGALSSQYAEVAKVRGTPAGIAVTLHGGWWRDEHDLSSMSPVGAHLHALGWEVHNLEYRRTGNDGGGWDVTRRDVEVALTAACQSSPGRPVILVGHSAGGHLALMAAPAAAITGIVALAPITDLVASHAQGLGEGATELFMQHDSSSAALRAASPVHEPPIVRQLVVHGTGDVRVPVQQSRGYVAAARQRGAVVSYSEIPGGDHFCVIDPGTPAWRAIDRWLQELTHS